MTAFDQAFTLLKMPIDWDTVTEPVWTPGWRAHENDTMDGEASAQWIHPETGERYDLRMDKWIRHILKPNEADIEGAKRMSPYMRESGELSVTQPMSEEEADALAETMDTSREVLAEYGDDQEKVGGTAFFNETDPFGRNWGRLSDDERSVPMPILPRELHGLGLGTDMYDLLNHWGVKLKPDDNQSKHARRLWARNQGYDRDIADQMATGISAQTAPYHSLLREAVRRVRESGLHPSFDFDPSSPASIVGLLRFWETQGYDEATEIKNWLDGAVASKKLPPLTDSPPWIERGGDTNNWYENYDNMRGGWTWRGHNERL
jgi:hypothetical protein